MMAMLWLALELTGSTTMMATVSLAETVPLMLVGLLGAPLLDRWDRLRLLVSLDMLRAVLVLSVPVAFLLGRVEIWQLVAVALCMGGLGALFDPALQAALPDLVPPAEYGGLAGLMDTPARLARILGPGFAGVLLAMMPQVHFFSLDAASFVLSALGLAAVSLWYRPAAARPPAPPANSRPGLRDDLRAAWAVVCQHQSLLAALAVDGLGNVGFPAYTLGGLLLVTHQYGSDVGGYGLLIAAYGVGSLAGNLVVGNADFARWRPILMAGGWLGIGGGFVLMGLAGSLPLACAAVVLSGAAGAVSHVTRTTYIGQMVPREHRGKVYSLVRLWSAACGAAGTLLVGWGLESLPASGIITISGVIICFGSAAALLLVRRQVATAAA